MVQGWSVVGKGLKIMPLSNHTVRVIDTDSDLVTEIEGPWSGPSIFDILLDCEEAVREEGHAYTAQALAELAARYAY